MAFLRRGSVASKELAEQTEIQDETLLAELGYKQELNRDWSLLHNFGVSFSIIVSPNTVLLTDSCPLINWSLFRWRYHSQDVVQSIVTGITTLFSYGLNTGGPGVMVTGWICVSFFTLFVGMSMAEITSAIPTSGLVAL